MGDCIWHAPGDSEEMCYFLYKLLNGLNLWQNCPTIEQTGKPPHHRKGQSAGASSTADRQRPVNFCGGGES